MSKYVEIASRIESSQDEIKRIEEKMGNEVAALVKQSPNMTYNDLVKVMNPTDKEAELRILRHALLHFAGAGSTKSDKPKKRKDDDFGGVSIFG